MRSLGCYFFGRGGVHRAFETALELGYTAIKFHARHPFRTTSNGIPVDHLHAYRDLRREHRSFPVFIQANKLVNIASPLEVDRIFAERQLSIDYQLGSYLEPTGIVLQAGNHKHFGEKAGIYQATKMLEKLTLKLIGFLGECTLILETSSGEGTSIGYKFENFKKIIDGLSAPYLVEICFDVSNVYASGYDIASEEGLLHTIDRFHSLLDIDRIACVNLSDADYPLGSKKRFRTELGKGEIGLEALERIVNHPDLADRPFILEKKVSKDYSGLHPDYATAKELMEKLENTDDVRKHKRLLSDQRFDFIREERAEKRRIALGIDDDEDYIGVWGHWP